MVIGDGRNMDRYRSESTSMKIRLKADVKIRREHTKEIKLNYLQFVLSIGTYDILNFWLKFQNRLQRDWYFLFSPPISIDKRKKKQ